MEFLAVTPNQSPESRKSHTIARIFSKLQMTGQLVVASYSTIDGGLLDSKLKLHPNNLSNASKCRIDTRKCFGVGIVER